MWTTGPFMRTTFALGWAVPRTRSTRAGATSDVFDSPQERGLSGRVRKGRRAILALASPLVGAQAPTEARRKPWPRWIAAKPLRRASCAAGRPRDAVEGAVSAWRASCLHSLFGARHLGKRYATERRQPAHPEWCGPRLRTCSIARRNEDYRDMYEKVRPHWHFARGRREVGLQARRGGRRILLTSKGFLLVGTKATPAFRCRGNVRVYSYRTCSIFHIVTCTIGDPN